MQIINQLSDDKPVSYEDMFLLCNLPGSCQSTEKLYSVLRQHLLGMRHLPVVALLITKDKSDLNTLFQEAEANNTVEVSTGSSICVYFDSFQALPLVCLIVLIIYLLYFANV